MIPLWDVSIMRQTYLVFVAFLLLLLVDNSSAALAQNLNLQTQMNQMAPPPQLPSPNLSVGRSHQPNAGRTERSRHSVHRQQKKLQAPASR
jgi:hypothetical protein